MSIMFGAKRDALQARFRLLHSRDGVGRIGDDLRRYELPRVRYQSRAGESGH